MKQFNMSKYASQADLFKDKASYYESECVEISQMAGKLFDQIMPQAGKLVLDIGLLNDFLIKISQYEKNQDFQRTKL